VVSFTPQERAPGSHWIGGWVGLRAGLDAVEKRKNPYPCREQEPGRRARSLLTILTEISRLLCIKCTCIFTWTVRLCALLPRLITCTHPFVPQIFLELMSLSSKLRGFKTQGNVCMKCFLKPPSAVVNVECFSRTSCCFHCCNDYCRRFSFLQTALYTDK